MQHALAWLHEGLLVLPCTYRQTKLTHAACLNKAYCYLTFYILHILHFIPRLNDCFIPFISFLLSFKIKIAALVRDPTFVSYNIKTPTHGWKIITWVCINSTERPFWIAAIAFSCHLFTFGCCINRDDFSLKLQSVRMVKLIFCSFLY